MHTPTLCSCGSSPACTTITPDSTVSASCSSASRCVLRGESAGSCGCVCVCVLRVSERKIGHTNTRANYIHTKYYILHTTHGHAATLIVSGKDCSHAHSASVMACAHSRWVLDINFTLRSVYAVYIVNTSRSGWGQLLVNISTHTHTHTLTSPGCAST
jgi:hypothetical protein